MVLGGRPLSRALDAAVAEAAKAGGICLLVEENLTWLEIATWPVLLLGFSFNWFVALWYLFVLMEQLFFAMTQQASPLGCSMAGVCLLNSPKVDLCFLWNLFKAWTLC